MHAGLLEPPRWEMRYNGEPAQGIALANVSGGNVVDTGRALDARLRELEADLPIGIEVHRVSWQSDEVSAAIDGFLVSLAQAVAIVLLVLTLPMGWRMGVIIGSGLLLTILGTFMVMSIAGIDLQRMSLGALVIALGMMVDNSIVIADGIAVRIQQGIDRKRAAIESASSTAWPLLGATIVAVMAFYPVYASPANAGEYCRTLFSVVAISLLLSWLIAMTITPLQCIDMLPEPKERQRRRGPLRRRLLPAISRPVVERHPLPLCSSSALRSRCSSPRWWPSAACARCSSPIRADRSSCSTTGRRRGPASKTVSQGMRPIEARLLESPSVETVTTFIGEGPAALLLARRSPGREPHLRAVHRQHALLPRDRLRSSPRSSPGSARMLPGAMVRVRKYGVGPAETWPFEARFSGPAEADIGTLRGLAAQGVAILADNSMATDVRTDTRERVRRLGWRKIHRTSSSPTTRCREWTGQSLPVNFAPNRCASTFRSLW